MHDLKELTRSLGIDFYRALWFVVSLIGSLGNETREGAQFLSSSKRLNILVEDLIGGRCPGSLLGNLLWVLRSRSTILLSQNRRDLGTLRVAMTGVASHLALASEVGPIEGVHHQHHLARRLLLRRIVGIPLPATAACIAMTGGAGLIRGSCKKAHRFHELLHGDALEQLHVFENLIRH